MRAAVVGGGIAGLAAALDLAEGGAEVTVFEATDRLGGKIDTGDLGGLSIDRGPDAFLARVPWAVELCRRLGLSDQLVSPAQSRAYLWWRGRLRPLPDGLVLGVPSDLGSLARSGLLTPAGMVRAALDLVLPATPVDDDATVGGLVSARFGRQVDERLVEPLLGSINASRTDQLSLQAAAPQLAQVAEGHRSLLAGLRAQHRKTRGSPSDQPVFLALPGGMGDLVSALEARLVELGVAFRTGTPVDPVARRASGTSVNGEVFDGVVVAVPAFAAAAHLTDVAPETARHLATIRYASVALALLSYPVESVPGPLAGSGFLVPRATGMLTTACSWASSKWAHLARPDRVVFRVSAGRIDDDRPQELSDAELVGRLHRELAEILSLRAEPTLSHVARWPRSFPQYGPGHPGLVRAIEATLSREMPGVVLAGAAYRGVGIPACIASGQSAARRLLDF